MAPSSYPKAGAKPLSPLTEKERSVLEFIEQKLADSGLSPSYQEIGAHFGFASINSVQNYLKQLIHKGYIRIPAHQKRAIHLLHPATTVQDMVQKTIQKTTQHWRQHSQRSSSSARSTDAASSTSAPPARSEVARAMTVEALRIPLLGKVAAGRPLEAFEYDEYIEATPSMVRNADKTFALRVSGQSMVEDGIFDGDVIFVQKQQSATNGEVVVATIENESTVKRFFLRQHPTLEKKMVELRPANSTMESMWFSPSQVAVQGVLVGLLRKFQ